MNTTNNRAGKNWSEEEIAYLENRWGSVSIPAIAGKLGRTVNSVKIKARKLGLGRHLHNSTSITFFQFCEAIGKRNSYSSIKQRWVHLGFPIHYQKSISKRFAMVDIDEFWEWAEKHKDIVDFHLIPEGIFGIEPDWVEEVRHSSYSGIVNKKPWSKSEDDKLIYLLNKFCYTYDQLCKKLNRSEGAIKRRILTLGLKQRPIRNYSKQWQDEEVHKLLKMRADGHCWEEIGRNLNRSGSAVRGKYERLQNPEYCKRYYRRQRELLQEYFQKDMCIHFIKTQGCSLNKTNCDGCTSFVRRQAGEKVNSGWNSIRAITPEEMMKKY